MGPADEGGAAGDVRAEADNGAKAKGPSMVAIVVAIGLFGFVGLVVLGLGTVTLMTKGEEPVAIANGYAENDQVAVSTGEGTVALAAPSEPSSRYALEAPVAEEAEAAYDPAPADFEASAGYGAPVERRTRSARAPRRAPSMMAYRGSGGRGLVGLDSFDAPRGGVGAAPPAAAAARPLPQNAVLANNFVGGSGASARLDDLLERGVMVGGERVRLAAFSERDALPYARPSREAVALHAEIERPRVDATGDTVHLQVALMAREGELPRRPRMDIRLVIDRSGSMSGEKFRHAMNAAHQLVRHLTPNDRIGIIGYDSDADVVLRSGRVGDGSRAHSALDQMVAGGGTNIDAGLSLAEADPPQRDRPSDLGLVVLISDGQATDGNGAPSYLGGIARRMYDQHGVLTTTIGLGTDFDENTMLTIAREGSGSYHFVRRPADITAILTDELEDRAQAVAQALRVRIVLGPGVTARRVYGSRALSSEEHQAVRRTEIATDTRIAEELGIAQNRQDEEAGLRMHLPTFRRGDQHIILMELDVPRGRATSRAGIAHVYLDYKDLYRESNGEAEVNVVARRVADRQDAIASTERTVKRTVLAFQAGEALQLAADALAAGDRTTARQVLTERREVLEAGAELWRDPLLARDAQLLAQYQRVVDGAWDGFGYGDQRTLVMAMGSFADRRMR